MEKAGKFAKVVILSILTFGIYGAYWIFININEAPDDSYMSGSEQNARNAQNIITLTWLNFTGK